MRLDHSAIVERFASWAEAGSLNRSYLLVGRDRARMAALAREVAAAIDPSGADSMTVEPEGASLGIARVRDARDHLAAFPAVAPYRGVTVIDAHLLTEEAQNALLKAAEEPGPRSTLILATIDEQRLLPTLRSRLYRIALEGAETGEGDGKALEVARALLSAPPAGVAAITKEAAASEAALTDVLRALARELAYTERTQRTSELWHRVQRLTAQAEGSPLSLRLQLNALFTELP